MLLTPPCRAKAAAGSRTVVLAPPMAASPVASSTASASAASRTLTPRATPRQMQTNSIATGAEPTLRTFSPPPGPRAGPVQPLPTFGLNGEVAHDTSRSGRSISPSPATAAASADGGIHSPSPFVGFTRRCSPSRPSTVATRQPSELWTPTGTLTTVSTTTGTSRALSPVVTTPCTLNAALHHAATHSARHSAAVAWPSRSGVLTPEFHDGSSPRPPQRLQSPVRSVCSAYPVLPPPRISGGGIPARQQQQASPPWPGQLSTSSQALPSLSVSQSSLQMDAQAIHRYAAPVLQTVVPAPLLSSSSTVSTEARKSPNGMSAPSTATSEHSSSSSRALAAPTRSKSPLKVKTSSSPPLPPPNPMTSAYVSGPLPAGFEPPPGLAAAAAAIAAALAAAGVDNAAEIVGYPTAAALSAYSRGVNAAVEPRSGRRVSFEDTPVGSLLVDAGAGREEAACCAWPMSFGDSEQAAPSDSNAASDPSLGAPAPLANGTSGDKDCGLESG